jgi:integrase
MARLFKQMWSKVMDGKRVRGKSAKWYAEYLDENGCRTRKPTGCTKLEDAKKVADKWERRAEQARAGIVEEWKPSPTIDVMIDQFLDSLRAKGRPDKHVDYMGTKLRRLYVGVPTIDDITLAAIESAVASLAADGSAAQTRNHYRQAAHQFARWLVRHRHLSADPLAALEKEPVDADRRRVRRAESTEVLRLVIEAAAKSRLVAAGLTGQQRAMLYAVAAATGFRAGELASMTVANFDLDGPVPCAHVEAGYSKRRRADTQPLPEWIVPGLRPLLATVGPGEPVWSGKWSRSGHGAAALRQDLETARQAWVAAAKDEKQRAEREASPAMQYQDARGRYFDFHALRATYITSLGRSGASPAALQVLARHSDPKLTFGIYTDHDLAERANVNRLPSYRLTDALPLDAGSNRFKPHCGTDGGGEVAGSVEKPGELSESE